MIRKAIILAFQSQGVKQSKRTVVASISTQKPFAENNDNGLGKSSFKGLALIKNTLCRSCRSVFGSKRLP